MPTRFLRWPTIFAAALALASCGASDGGEGPVTPRADRLPAPTSPGAEDAPLARSGAEDESQALQTTDLDWTPPEPVWRRVQAARQERRRGGGRRPASRDGFTPPHMEGVEPVRIALLLPLSAPSESVRNLASAMFDAAQLAIFDSADSNLLLLPKDTGGTAEGAARAAELAIYDGAELILGPLFATSVAAVAEPAGRAGVPVIAFSSDLSVAGDGVYLLSSPPEIEIARIADFAASRGYHRFAVLAPQSDYGRKVADAFAEEVFVRGGLVAKQDSYAREPSEMFAPARRLADYDRRHRALLRARASLERAEEDDPQAKILQEALEPLDTLGPSEFDAVLLPEQGNLLRALAPLMPYFGVDPRRVKLIGTSLWHDESLLREPALSGGWFAAPDPELTRAFSQKYQSAYGVTPPRLASLAYDGAALAARLARRGGYARFTAADLTDPRGFIGVDGLYRFTPDGRIERALAILEIRPGGFRVVDPAPQSFARELY